VTTAYEIPTASQPQTQVISLNGTVYTLTLHWCAPASCWILDIADKSGNPILTGIPLVTGANLLDQFDYLNIGNGGALIVQSSNDPTLVPSFSTLGTTGHLFFISPNP
jgi:hypothetical protein